MKMVAAAKLRRAQEAKPSRRARTPTKLEGMVSQDSCNAGRLSLASAHARRRNERALPRPPRVSDRGLCGGYNANLLKAVASVPLARRARTAPTSITCVGKQGVDHFRRRARDRRHPRHAPPAGRRRRGARSREGCAASLPRRRSRPRSHRRTRPSSRAMTQVIRSSSQLLPLQHHDEPERHDRRARRTSSNPTPF